MEMGRMMFIWTQLTSAAQEGTRYGLAHPLEVISVADDGGNAYPCTAHNDNPCNIVAQSRSRVVLLNAHDDVHVEVAFDNGSGAKIDPWRGQMGCNPTVLPTFNVGADRVVVTTTYQFHFLIGIFDNFAPNGLRLQMVSARTVMANEQRPPTIPCTYNPGQPTPPAGPLP